MKFFFHLNLVLLIVGCTPDFEPFAQLVEISPKGYKGVIVFGGSKEDIAHGVIQTKDGGFAVIGNTKSNDGDFHFKISEDSDIFLLKYDAANELVWAKTYGGSGDDRGYDLVELKQGGYALIGYSSSSDGDASRNEGMHDHWVILIDEMGTIVWEKSFGFAGHDHAYNIIQTPDGGFFFNGFLDVTASGGAGQDGKAFSSNRHGVGEFWAQKIDDDGNLIWRNYYGGTNNDRSYDAILTSDGNYLLVGTSESQDVDISQPKGSYDIWVVKINNKGKLLWERSFGGSSFDRAASVIEYPLGNYIIAGQSLSSDGDIIQPKGNSDILLVELNNDGSQSFVKNLGGPNFDSGEDLIPTQQGSILVLGTTHSKEIEVSSNVVSQTNENTASILYEIFPFNRETKTYILDGSGIENPYALDQKQNGTVVVVGSTTSTDGLFQVSYGEKDIFIAFWN